MKAIAGFEGGQRLDVNYPDVSGPHKSGATVGTGYDIGQRTKDELVAELGEALGTKLAPYAKMTGERARDFVKAHPLVLTREEVAIVDRAAKRSVILKVARAYNSASKVRFEDLPEEAQTVIASVAFQHGANLRGSKGAPKFWDQVIHQRWAEAAQNLRNWTSKKYGPGSRLKGQMLFVERRNDEAAMLDRLGQPQETPRPAVPAGTIHYRVEVR